MNPNYQELSRLIRQLEVKELQTGNYTHLKNPNRKQTIPSPSEFDFSSCQFRVNFLFRPTPELGNNTHNLHIGRTEIVLEYHGIPHDDYHNGFSLERDRPLRLITGEYLFNEMKVPLLFFLDHRNILTHLGRGEYQSFVEKTLSETNRIIDEYKKIYKQDPKSLK